MTKARGRISSGKNPRWEPRPPTLRTWRRRWRAVLGWGGLLAPSGCSQCTCHQHVSFRRFGFLPLSGPPTPLLRPHVSTGPPFPLFFLQTSAPLGLYVFSPSHTCSSPSLRGSAVTTTPLLRTDVQKQLSARPVSELSLKSLPPGHAFPASPLRQRPSSSGLIPIPKRTLVDTRAVFPTCRFYPPFLTLLDESPCPAVTPQQQGVPECPRDIVQNALARGHEGNLPRHGPHVIHCWSQVQTPKSGPS